ncbi:MULTISPECIES: LysR family transcriptional regulator [unclassified Serratia (in: enterobacteria)]|uniref:LysR family transcriptional regulator n=1 Tax=unclassified Serratia (in: enterobacteria) TaxID=2647522 RepID=UPI000AC7EAE6|nr:MULTISPECIES: LysR family transcriptional regulator [unclassified Serratia (in: enterobacteria)]
MAIKLPSLTSLRAFEAAARLGSFKKAAEELAVTATAISHRIRVLEEYLEHPLFLRKVRAVELTANGVALFTAVHSSFETIGLAIEHIRKPRRSSVTLSTTPAFATKWLVPRLASFQEAYPDIDLHIHASNTPVDLNAGTADLAIRYGQGRPVWGNERHATFG